MEQERTQIAARLRRRAFRSRNARHALKLLALADEVPSMHLPHAGRVLVHIAAADKPRPGDTPQLRALRKRKRWLDMARPLTRHPRLLEGLADLLPRARGRPGANLRTDLMMDDDEVEALRVAAEEAFGVHLDRRAVDEWETLNDVTESIAAVLSTEAA